MKRLILIVRLRIVTFDGRFGKACKRLGSITRKFQLQLRICYFASLQEEVRMILCDLKCNPMRVKGYLQEIEEWGR